MVATADKEQSKRNSEKQSADDWELIRLVGSGDQSALEQLYRQYYSGLYRFILQITRRVDCVEELINDVMFVVWEKAADVVPLSKASTWILGIAHNKALQASRRGRSIGSLVSNRDTVAEPELTQDVSMHKFETEEVLFALMGALSPEQRAVMELVYYNGLHYTEIAQMIDCPENTVKTRVFQARKKLRHVWPLVTGSGAPDAGHR